MVGQLFPDSVFEEQATYISDQTPLTRRQSEVYLRWRHLPDDDVQNKNREIANHIGCSESTVSKHLSDAKEKLDKDRSLKQTLMQMILMTEIGGHGGINRKSIASKRTDNSFILFTTTELRTEDYTVNPKYIAHIMYTERSPDIDIEDLPDDIISYDKHSIFTVKSSDEEHFAKSLLAYAYQINSLGPYDIIAYANLLEESIGVVDLPDEASDIVQEAMNVIGHP